MFFLYVSRCPKTEPCFLFFFSSGLSFFFFGSGRTDKNTNSESDIIYIINAHKNGGYKRTNVSEREREREREREEMNNASSSAVLSSFSFFSVSVSF